MLKNIMYSGNCCNMTGIQLPIFMYIIEPDNNIHNSFIMLMLLVLIMYYNIIHSRI